MTSLDLDQAAQVFSDAVDFTVGLEEEFAVLDPATLDLAARFEELRDLAALEDPQLHEAITGELISSEIEIISGRGDNLRDAISSQRDARHRLFALARAHDVALAATGTHPWADYRKQPIIDTEHYRRVEEGLKYVAWRNNTFSLHVHVGIRDIDRAVRVCDRMREVCCWRYPPTRRIWTAVTRGFTRRAPRALPEAFPAAGFPTHSAVGRPTAST
jgi:carboxylate-amine ligase